MRFENLFKMESNELMYLDTLVVAEEGRKDVLYKLEEKGVARYRDFVKHRLLEKTKSLYDPISKQNTKIFVLQKKSGPSVSPCQLRKTMLIYFHDFS